MRVNLDAAASLEVIGWLYIAAGLAASIALVVNFFTPVEQPLVAIHFGPPSINLGVLLLPIGIGLRLHGAMSRRVALALSWFIAVLLPVAAILLVVAATSGAAIESTWTPALPLGDAVSRAILFVMLFVPVFVWQLRVLGSASAQQLTERHGTS